ncbi:hypothetical protein SLS56_009048 [Neofusicoccum ribis]|uniref:Uncharacterized protein n=1 Tax=Neofusicoccum ribis TaxID=45134 RepID=A0ABR3SJ94_9PEZI
MAFVDRASVDLFELTSELFSFSGEDIDALADDNHTHVSFPFEFRFPWVVSTPPPLYEGESFKRSDDFEHLRGHALPPSMRTKCKGYNQAISYHLEAILTTTSLVNPSRRVRQPLTFSPPHPPLGPPPPSPITTTISLTRRHHRLAQPPTRRRPHLLTRLKQLLARAPPPTATFALTTTTPTSLRAGHAVPLTVALAHQQRSASLPAPPPVALRAYRATLTARTRVRVPYRHNAARELADGAAERAWAVRRAGAAAPLGARPVSLGEGALVVPREVVPGFRSYGLARAYELEVVLWVQCAGKVFEVLAARHAVEVLPVVESGEVLGLGEEREGEEPPPYEPPPYRP